MLEKLKDVPPGIEALSAVGTISKEDYEKVFEPLVDEARQKGRHIRLLCQIGPEYQGVTPVRRGRMSRSVFAPWGSSTAARS